MSELYLDGKKIYYEIHGQAGEVLILLNGIMMTTNSWTNFIPALSRNNRLVLVDFFDQGRSERLEPGYDHQIQIQLLGALFRQLEAEMGVSRFVLAGLSYGGNVALQAALAFPERVKRLILANSASRTSSWLRNVGDGWNEVAKSGNGRSYYLTAIPVIYSTRFFEAQAAWMEQREETLVAYFSQKEVLERMIRLTDSSRHYNVEDRLGEIQCPTLILSSSEDALVPVTEQELLHKGIKNSSHVVIRGSGHASMYEFPEAFAGLIAGFAGLGDEEIHP